LKMAGKFDIEITTIEMDVVRERISNNTDLKIKKIVAKIPKHFILPNAVKNGYTLEAYVLDLLLLAPKLPTLNKLKVDDWMLILNAMVSRYGFSCFLVNKIWPLVVNYEFNQALSHLCRSRLQS